MPKTPPAIPLHLRICLTSTALAAGSLFVMILTQTYVLLQTADHTLWTAALLHSSARSTAAARAKALADNTDVRGHYQTRLALDAPANPIETPLSTPADRRQERRQERLETHGLEDTPASQTGSLRPEALTSWQPLIERGTYLGPSTVADSVDEYLDAIEANGGNAVIMDVKAGYVYFQSQSSLAEEIGLIRPFYDLPAVVQKAKARDLYLLARYVAAKDASLAVRRPETRLRHPRTGASPDYVWVDPAHPTVLEVNRQVLRDLAVSGVDEINLDYIRYPTEYSAATLGITAEERADRVEQFVIMAREVINEHAPHVRLGLSTFAILGWDYEVNLKRLGQDVVRFAPLVDVISPMAYPSTFSQGNYYNPAKHPGSRNYYLVYQTLEGYKELLGDEHAHKLRPWIQAYYMSVKGLQDQMQAVYDTGACGFTVWSANNIYGKFYQALKTMAVPAHCQRSFVAMD